MLKCLNLEGNRLRNLPKEVWMAPNLRELNCMNNEIMQLCLITLNLDNRNRDMFKHRTSRYAYKQENFLDKRSFTQNILNIKNLEMEKKQSKEITNKNIKKVENIVESDIIR